MKEYFDNDQLNMLPKPIMKTSLLTQMKNNRELPLYGFKQSMNIIQPTITHTNNGDGNKSKTLEDLLAFKNRIDYCYASNSLAVINGRIRFDHEKLYAQLRKLSARMSQYQYRFVIIYWVSYLEDFEKATEEHLTHIDKQRGVVNQEIRDFMDPERYELEKKTVFEISAASSIFFEKLGKHPETKKIFKILGFQAVRAEPPNDPSFVRLYRCDKTKDNLRRVKRISDLLNKIASMDV